uniref:(northern house mosquito) hypothetical protein n=1 Tax=Culex pipiens TaxID=7175 RepID=A0A8D8C3M4_CULPI
MFDKHGTFLFGKLRPEHQLLFDGFLPELFDDIFVNTDPSIGTSRNLVFQRIACFQILKPVAVPFGGLIERIQRVPLGHPICAALSFRQHKLANLDPAQRRSSLPSHLLDLQPVRAQLPEIVASLLKVPLENDQILVHVLDRPQRLDRLEVGQSGQDFGVRFEHEEF